MILRSIRQFQCRLIAARREAATYDRVMAEGQTWTSAEWRRQTKYANRLYRLAHGKSPWRPFNGF